MARTKADVKNGHALRARRANELAAIAQCMDGFLRNQNERMEEIIEELTTQMRLNEIKHRACLKQKLLRQRNSLTEHFIAERNQYIYLLQRREERIRELEREWEDLANTLHDALEENEQLRRCNVRMSEQLLDQDTEVEELTD